MGFLEVLQKIIGVFGKIIFYTTVHFLRLLIKIVNAVGEWLGGLISGNEE